MLAEGMTDAALRAADAARIASDLRASEDLLRAAYCGTGARYLMIDAHYAS